MSTKSKAQRMSGPHGSPALRSREFTSPTAGWVRSASLLSNNHLLIVGGFSAPTGAPLEAALVLGEQVTPIEFRFLPYCISDESEDDPDEAKVMLARLPEGAREKDRLGRLTIHSDGKIISIFPDDLSEALTTLPTLIRLNLASLSSRTRTEVLAFLATATATEEGRWLSRSLSTVRDALRERLPYCVVAPDCAQGMDVDNLIAIDERSFYISGWMRDDESEVTHLTAVSPEGARIELLDRAFRYRRTDIEQFYGDPPMERSLEGGHGFIRYFELEAPSRLSAGWVVEMCIRTGQGIEVKAPAVDRDSLAARNVLLHDLSRESLNRQELKVNHSMPALSRLQDRQRERVRVDDVEQFGTLPDHPRVSIIVPLYQRLDFLEHQMAQFVHDPEIGQADLIYVLDSPELAETFRISAYRLFQLYRVPFRVATMTHNAGFSGATNAGASLARGQRLLLLNSDVLPDRPGWLGEMTAFYDSTPNVGALGAKLLFEDDSLQHAGLYFSLVPGTNQWENQHYYKGMHRRLPAANVTRPVPAVTAACLMISTELYRGLGGLHGMYVQGDYEDSDLCLRLLADGRENWYLPDVELYHLEGQSYPTQLRELTTRYNRWLQSHLWGPSIEAVMGR